MIPMNFLWIADNEKEDAVWSICVSEITCDLWDPMKEEMIFNILLIIFYEKHIM